jgi:hypothetical protein
LRANALGVTTGAAITITLIVAVRLPLNPEDWTDTVPVPAVEPAVKDTVVNFPSWELIVSEFGDTLHDCTVPVTLQEMPSVTVSDVLFVTRNSSLRDLFTTSVSVSVHGLIAPPVCEHVNMRCVTCRAGRRVAATERGRPGVAASKVANTNTLGTCMVSSRGEQSALLR